ncbi:MULTISPECIES: RluA family pseudouridine synthase [unclassified Sporosarcina]|uniref:RluA family pseudouridine synthase n=1 Tax=unclassified Sporosarcina TaxID=2647733 RepID=UPI000C16F3A5|nr:MULTISPECIES: RluA family pseudouridine synthase [unclassified Sporosarcina]PID17318.1 RNA pseudouridine synthase [Sporosarcina sp. P35]
MKKNNSLFQLHFDVTHSGLLRDFLAQHDISKTTLTAIKYQGGEILVNGQRQNVRYKLQPADRVSVLFPPEQVSDGLTPQDGELSILYEDETILVLDKPAGQSTIPSRNHPFGTLANFVCGKFEREGILSTVHMVTRLDTDTSGIICAAKNRHIHHLLSKQMSEKLFRRQYTAFAEGIITPSFITVEQPIGRKEGSIIERTVCENGQYAKTDVSVTGHYHHETGRFSIVNLNLHTGRTHQIRVHMQWLGHPLVGDDLYGANGNMFARQALHCSGISFLHPLTKERIDFTSPLPEDMAYYLRQSGPLQDCLQDIQLPAVQNGMQYSGIK